MHSRNGGPTKGYGQEEPILDWFQKYPVSSLSPP